MAGKNAELNLWCVTRMLSKVVITKSGRCGVLPGRSQVLFGSVVELARCHADVPLFAE